ncbi:hypothetical protein PIB30_050967 [Stylosanthes scabra]|uniref:Acid phosphatase/vanadium-dependent haloperoxidase-related protein n=1 Tax=Stylosanthes scabra TaxID=79078 RepID=A0ABU6YG28_9FABA|nr:hypothetical protein [Stylosanthes scabra]
MMTWQHHSIFAPINPPLIKHNNTLFHHRHHRHQHFPKSKALSTFRISSSGAASSFQDIAEIAQNKVLIAAGASVLIGQLSKPFSSVFLYGKDFDIRALVQAGGFPSSHSSATMACATFLGLERGFSDPIFGLTIVYAGLIMYDAQGVRREVGIHARTLNKLLRYIHIITSIRSKDNNDGLINSKTGFEKSILSQEATTSLDPKQGNNNNLSLLVKQESKLRQTEVEKLSSTETEEIRKLLVSDGLYPLKESIGHTEVEVIAGALLGIIVGLAVYNLM